MKASEEARKLWPYLLPLIQRVARGGGGGASGSPGIGGAPTPHALGSSHHVGTLADSQAPQFLLRNGTRSLTGNLAVDSGKTIDGVDISAHAANPNAHHDAATAGNGISVTGQLIAVALASNPGLEFSSGLLRVDAYNGILRDANGISINLETTSGLTLSGSGLAVADSIAGNGLVIASKVLAVNPGDGIDIVSDAVAVDVTDIIDTGAGLGEDASNNIQVKRDSNSGLVFGGSGGLAVGTPTAIAYDSLNTVSGTSHVHAVTASSNVGAGVPSLLKSTGSGGLTLASLDVTGSVVVDQSLTAAGTGFRVIHHAATDPDTIPMSGDETPAHAHVVVNPTGSWSLDEQFGLDVDDNLLVRGWIVGKHAIQVAGAKMLLHFDGPEPYETNWVGNPTGHMGQPATSVGGVVYRPGKFGKAVQLAGGIQNRVTNPSFEVDTAGWDLTQNGTGATATRTADKSYVGYYSVALIGSSTGNSSWNSPAFNVLNNGRVNFQARIWRSSNYTSDLVLYDNTNATIRATITPTLTEEWELVSGDWHNSIGGTISVEIRARNGGGPTGTMYIDAVQGTRVNDPTTGFLSPYADGSMGGFDASGVPTGAGHTWTGTAHASDSIRTPAVLTYPAQGNISANKGTIMAWVNPLSNVPSTLQYVFAHYNSGNRIYLFIGTNGNWWVGMGSNATLLDTGEAALYNQWSFVVMSWDGTTVKFYHNCSEAESAPNASSAYSSLTTIGTTLYVGSSAAGIEHFNGWIDELSIIDRVLPDSEIKAIYESGAPIFAETSTFSFRAGRNRIWADSEGLWGYAANGGTIIGLYAGEDGNPAATKSWGGLNLAEGDMIVGDSNRGAFMLWDDSAATLVLGKTGSSNENLYLTGNSIAMRVDTTYRFSLTNDVMQINDSGGAAVFTFNASAGAEFTKPLTFGTSGGIYQGSGTFASPTTGLKIWRDSSIGRIAGYNSGTLQWGADTDGKLKAGAGSVVLDATGAHMAITNTAGATTSSLNFEYGGSRRVYVSAIDDGSVSHSLLLKAESVTGHTSTVGIRAEAPSGQSAQVTLETFLGATATGELLVGNGGAGQVEVGQNLYINQNNSSLARASLIMQQADLSEEFIRFNGTVGASNPISNSSAGPYAGKIRISINGTFFWLSYTS